MAKTEYQHTRNRQYRSLSCEGALQLARYGGDRLANRSGQSPRHHWFYRELVWRGAGGSVDKPIVGSRVGASGEEEFQNLGLLGAGARWRSGPIEPGGGRTGLRVETLWHQQRFPESRWQASGLRLRTGFGADAAYVMARSHPSDARGGWRLYSL